MQEREDIECQCHEDIAHARAIAATTKAMNDAVTAARAHGLTVDVSLGVPGLHANPVAHKAVIVGVSRKLEVQTDDQTSTPG